MTVAKDQHFLPQFYLRQFVDPDIPSAQEPYVWVYNTVEHLWRRRAPKNVAALRYYYAYRDENNQLINTIEPAFTAIESIGAVLIRKLKSHEKLTDQEQLQFSFFIALLTVRTPQYRDITDSFLKRIGQNILAEMIHHWRKNPDEFKKSKRQYNEKAGTTFDMEIEDLEKSPPQVVMNEAGLLGYSLVPVSALAARLFELTWRFYFTDEEDRFIICDHPCDFALPEDMTEESFQGFFTKDVEFHVPLTPNLIFAAHDDGFDRAFGGLLNRDEVALINRRMVNRAEKFIISAKPTFWGEEILQTEYISRNM